MYPDPNEPPMGNPYRIALYYSGYLWVMFIPKNPSALEHQRNTMGTRTGKGNHPSLSLEILRCPRKLVNDYSEWVSYNPNVPRL